MKAAIAFFHIAIKKYFLKIDKTLYLLLLLGWLVIMPIKAEGEELLLATTTSTDNTGLLDYLAPMFSKSTGVGLKWVATGTGKALKLGENCDCDVLLVHAPTAEEKFVKDGFGGNRRRIMFNDFVIIGPDKDPAQIKGLEVCASLNKIHGNKSIFVSRGDNSGTNNKELSLWEKCLGELPQERWYLQTGQGMLATINISSERHGYTMTDRGTFIKYEVNNNGNPPLKILVEGDKSLLNIYSVLEVNQDRCPKVKQDLARNFGDWLVSKAGQTAIGSFRLLNKQLFTPDTSSP